MNHKRIYLGALFLLFVVFALTFFVSVIGARDVTLSLVPDKGGFEAGEIFSVRLEINAFKKINVVAASIRFPPELLDVVSVSSENSILKLWVTEANFSSRRGTIDFEGGLFNGGFLGKGNVIDIRFMAKAEGEATVFIESATVLAHDGLGTALDVEKGRAKYIIRKIAPVATFPIFGSPKMPILSPGNEQQQPNRYDLNQDGRVDVFDVIYFMRYWLGAYDPRLDFNNDGRVGISDFSILISKVFE